MGTTCSPGDEAQRHPRDEAAASGRVDDGGITLIELLVSMIVLSIFMALCSTALIGIIRSVHKQTGVIDAQMATRTAFLLLDKQVRYADAVTSPGTVSGNQWIEWRVPDPSIPVGQSSSQDRCHQWEATAAGTLRYRSWIVPTTGAVSIPAWQAVASGLVIGTQPVFTTTVAGLAAAPFLLPATGQTYGLGHAQVGLSLAVTSNAPAGRAAFTTVLTALNSSAAPAAVCTEVPRS